ncbi:MAG: hypothetical protein KDB74_01345 [Flavobacteriales bacterium]|nr:hypothetical protein [Flavobacteriales bacterium]
MPLKIKFKKLHKDAVIPTKAHASDACYDLTAVSKKDLGDGRIEYEFGFALGLPPEVQADIRARSSIHKHGLVLSNGIGTIDSAFCGPIKAVFYKLIPSLPDYEVGNRIAQIQVPGFFELEFVEVDELEQTDRGDKGYGSSGK